ncbi:hypothetical protein ACM257_17515 [Alteromonas macleodii]|uniref:hypothetical protein n=1 Tax=Alteromonas macleodii TaxID=28108 RepID=UPI0039F6E0CA
MNPRIEKKVSKRLFEVAPSQFHDVWQDNECPTDYADLKGSSITGCLMIGGGLSYWGEGEDAHSLHTWFMQSWMFCNRFTLDWDGENWPDTGKFKPTAKNIIALAREEHELNLRKEQE